MIIIRILIALSLLGLVSACGGPGESADIPEAQPAGATSADIGDHIVHFSAQTTDQLPPEVARLYSIVRSKNRAMLNVSVLQEAGNKAVTAVVTVKTVNLTGQSGASFREIIDLSDWDNSVGTNVPGQSGQPGSPHYDDLVSLWANGEYFPLLFSREAIVENTANLLTLRPAN